MLAMEVFCGTHNAERFDIVLDKYASRKPNEASTVEQQKAFDLLHSTMFDDTFADDGCRNEDAVNACIALHVLGYDAGQWFENFCNEQKRNEERWFPTDLSFFMNHVERVCKYLYRWGPKGNEGNALNYSI